MGGIKSSVQAVPKPKDSAIDNSTSTKTKHTSLSAEYIVDSDSDAGVEITERTKKPAKLPSHKNNRNGAARKPEIKQIPSSSSQSRLKVSQAPLSPEKKSTTLVSRGAKVLPKKEVPSSQDDLIEVTRGGEEKRKSEDVEGSWTSEDEDDSEAPEDAEGSDNSAAESEKAPSHKKASKVQPKQQKVIADSEESTEDEQNGEESSEGGDEPDSESKEQPERSADRPSTHGYVLFYNIYAFSYVG
jgi:hypothetical protein